MAGKMPEDVLVALAAMHHCGLDPSRPFFSATVGDPGVTAMPSAVVNYLRTETHVTLLTAWHARFTRLASGVHVH